MADNKERFAKLFDFPNGMQVLVTKMYNMEDETYDVKSTTLTGGAIMVASEQYAEKHEQESMFIAYDREKAILMHDALTKTIAG